jgi:DNA-binding SARP family transcriptional activator
VQVRARGVLSIKVNGRAVPIRPVSRAGELLVLLLEGGGEESVERLVAALYPDHETKAGKNALSKQVTTLRKALGWECSVEAVGGGYRLDDTAHWSYDVDEARTHGENVHRFMEGVYSEWALEVARRLGGDSTHTLN